MKLIMLIGLPGSGKSTWIKNSGLDYVVLSIDDLITKEYPNLIYSDAYKTAMKTGKLKEFEKVFKMQIKEAIQNKLNVIIDKTNLTYNGRKKILSKFIGYEKTAIVFELSESKLNEQLEKRKKETGKDIPMWIINNMRKSYVPPTKEEFNNIEAIL